jgi:hypothetical protein
MEGITVQVTELISPVARRRTNVQRVGSNWRLNRLRGGRKALTMLRYY